MAYQAVQEVFDFLVKEGCTDLHASIDEDRYSSLAIASGGFGDVRQTYMRDGRRVAVKFIRQHTLRTDPKSMKVYTCLLVEFDNSSEPESSVWPVKYISGRRCDTKTSRSCLA